MRLATIPFLLLLTACTSQEPVLNSPATGVQPLITPIFVGTAPIKAATLTLTQDFHLFGRYGSSGRVKTVSNTLLSANSTSDSIDLLINHIGFEIERQKVSEAAAASFDQSEYLDGVVARVSYDRKQDVSVIDATKFGQPFNLDSFGASLPGKLFTRFNLAGRTIHQDQQVFSLGSGDISTAGNQVTTLEALGFVRGVGFFENRQVLSVDVVGRVSIGANTVRASGLYLVDVESGAYVYGEVEITGLRSQGTTGNLRISQRLKM